jgi:hypothetical protein
LHLRRATRLAEAGLEETADGLFSPLLSTAKIGRFASLLLSFWIKRERSAHESALHRSWRYVPADFRDPLGAFPPTATRESRANRRELLKLRPCLGRLIDAARRPRRLDRRVATPSSAWRKRAIGKRGDRESVLLSRGGATTSSAQGA